jgi:hypothetical protein
MPRRSEIRLRIRFVETGQLEEHLCSQSLAAGVDLTEADLAELDALPPPVGARY